MCVYMCVVTDLLVHTSDSYYRFIFILAALKLYFYYHCSCVHMCVQFNLITLTYAYINFIYYYVVRDLTNNFTVEAPYYHYYVMLHDCSISFYIIYKR